MVAPHLSVEANYLIGEKSNACAQRFVAWLNDTDVGMSYRRFLLVQAVASTNRLRDYSGKELYRFRGRR